MNISKAIETVFLKNAQDTELEWNKRGRLDKNAKWIKDNCDPIKDILKEIGAPHGELKEE